MLRRHATEVIFTHFDECISIELASFVAIVFYFTDLTHYSEKAHGSAEASRLSADLEAMPLSLR